VFQELRRRAAAGRKDSIRDMLTLAQYAQKLRASGLGEPLRRAVQQVLVKPDGTAPAGGRAR